MPEATTVKHDEEAVPPDSVGTTDVSTEPTRIEPGG